MKAPQNLPGFRNVDDSTVSAPVGKTADLKIFWLSFLLLFAEVMAVRWLGVELAIVRVFPNLVVMVVMVATSAGLAASGRPGKLSSAQQCLLVAAAVFALTIPLIFSVQLGLPDLALRVDAAPQIVGMSLLALSVVILSLYVCFQKLGYALGGVFDKLPPLKAYALNLLGSLVGVAAFAAISWLSLAPWVWLLIVGTVSYILYQRKIVIAATVLLAGLALVFTSSSMWSPYSKLDVKPFVSAPGSVLGTDNYVLNSNNYYFHAAMRMLDDKEQERFDKEPHNTPQVQNFAFYHRWLRLPFACANKHERVLILGSGSGNDAAFALIAGAKDVDAVEIDPLICGLGKTRHPNRPYLDPRVHIHNEDARTFLRYGRNKYDLVEFAFLDPGATVNSASFLRVDNYVYTVEAMKAALRLVNDDGVVCVTFATGPQSAITRRIYQTITDANGSPPIAYTGADWGSVIYLFGPGAKPLAPQLIKTADLKPFPGPGDMRPTKAATDQWPFLYLEYDSGGIWLYIMVLVAAVVLPATVLIKSGGTGISSGEWANMFFLGQAFMLMETKSITHLSLLLGATWIVSSAVIFTVLVLAYLANLTVSKGKAPSVPILYCLLIASLILQYFLHIPESTNIPPMVIAAIYCIIDCLPVMFGSMIFSSCFGKTRFSNQALAANMLGVSLGGLTENLCVVTGVGGLTFVAIGLYVLSLFSLTRIPQSAAGAPEKDS